MKYTTHYTVEFEIVEKFNKKVPATKRSGVVEKLISDFLNKKSAAPNMRADETAQKKPTDKGRIL